jgi:transcriptional regulator with XRE-family HTH domain
VGKALKVSATTAAEAAGMSRMTLHRIERGEPSVTMGAYTYERNWRHVDKSALDANERQLLADLARALGRKPMNV